MRGIFKFLATGFDVGFLPGAPGTYGTVVGVGLYLLVAHLPIYLYLLFTITFAFFAIWVTNGALPSFKRDDPSEIVIDEMAGFLVTMIGLPVTWLNIGMGFVFFRLFDIIKPPPIRMIDRKMKGGLGVVSDDLLAGVFACALIWIIRLFV